MQSTRQSSACLHVAIIMDGNGRWARSRLLERSAGHRQGACAVRHTVEAAPDLDISVLTLFAFSANNWQRPPSEIGSLMFLLERFLEQERQSLIDSGIRLDVIGRRDRLQPAVARAIAQTESATAAGSHLLLRLAIDYSARHAIAIASRLRPHTGADPSEDFRRRLDCAMHATVTAPPVDLVIRTSGEQRLSDFLLWESAYAELVFLPVLWPDFDRGHLEAAIKCFRARDRRFGCLPAPSHLETLPNETAPTHREVRPT